MVLSRAVGRAATLLIVSLLAGCGVRSAIATPEARPHDAAPDARERPVYDACAAVDDACAASELCDNGSDDDCDGLADEGCGCAPGSVQSCFAGPPGRRNVGACADGQQICGLSGTWGECSGGVVPRDDLCNGLDNLCDGCSAHHDCEIACPEPDDPSIVDGAPFAEYPLNGSKLYPGPARSYQWRVRGGVCDQLAPQLVSFDLVRAEEADAAFTPRLSGDYTVDFTVTTLSGTALSCSYIVHVRAPGLRIEMCYPESEQQDLDLVLHEPNNVEDWYPRRGNAHQITPHACSWSNCEAVIRGTHGRVDFGYAWSPLPACVNGPHGSVWRALGACGNPRLDIDNNLDEGTGLPENINIDAPGDGETFRVMVQNFTGGRSRPVVNVYCDGTRLGTYGVAPDEVPNFEGRSGNSSAGAMWRVVDVTTYVGADGLACDLTPLHPKRHPDRYLVTQDDGRY